jgi:hypothetical protein
MSALMMWRSDTDWEMIAFQMDADIVEHKKTVIWRKKEIKKDKFNSRKIEGKDKYFDLEVKL